MKELPKSRFLSKKQLLKIKNLAHKSGYKIPMKRIQCEVLLHWDWYILMELERIGWVTQINHDGLSVRASNCLMNAGIDNKKEAAKAIRNLTLSPNPKGNHVKYYGQSTHREVCKWAGLIDT